MNNVAACDYIYLVTIDLAALAKPEDRDRLGKALLAKLDAALGSFETPVQEGELLIPLLEKAAESGGKQVFTDRFLRDIAPYVAEREHAPGFLVAAEDGTGLPMVPRGGVFTVESTSWRYRHAKLRIFRAGVIGLELRFSWSPPTPLDCATLVTAILHLERSWASVAAYHKLKHVVTSAGNSTGIQLNLPGDHGFPRSASTHRLIILQSFTSNGTPLEFDEIYKEDEALRAVSGLLNRSEWFSNYCNHYIAEIRAKFVAYQKDEFFITDRNSTLVLFPQFFSHLAHKVQFVENVIVGMHYLLSWEAFARRLEVTLDTSMDRSTLSLSPQPTRRQVDALVAALTATLDSVMTLRDALAIGGIVDHGFTGRVLTRFVDERELSRRVDSIGKKLEAAAKMLEVTGAHARQEAVGGRARRLSRFAVIVAAVSLVLAALFQFLNYQVNLASLRFERARSIQEKAESRPIIGGESDNVTTEPTPLPKAR